jgi:uncharacterized protein YyaL (SSP411 family)
MPNKLIHSTSPYLLQHAHNPVDWHEWGKEALDKAVREDKPILVSIGYSSCHWCHVMEHESFEKESIAAVMNKFFVCIKVDREERPDIDQVYMDAVHMLGVQGGWPLNVFLTSEQKPFFGGTYFSPQVWVEVLNNINRAYRANRKQIEETAEELRLHLLTSEVARYKQSPAPSNLIPDLNEIYNKFSAKFDRKWGGLDKEPKFIMPSIWLWMLRISQVTKNPEALGRVTFTLKKIAKGGIYDQIGGGFARYSVDRRWFAPHFEKMLYDNAQLLTLYSEAYSVTEEESFRTIVYETFDWLQRTMTDANGGFFSALDADSEGVEGKYYVWTKNQLREILQDHESLISAFYGVTETGNWEHGTNILMQIKDEPEFLREHVIKPDEWNSTLRESKAKLLEVRNGRIPPALDDKIITGWNAMMVGGLTDAFRAFGESRFLDAAVKNIRFMEDNLFEGAKLYRSFKMKRSHTEGFLDDYAFYILALVRLYQVTFNEAYINRAKQLNEYVIAQFFDPADGFFFYTSRTAEPLISRKKEIFDNVIPSSNAVMAQNLNQLGLLLDRDDWKKMAITMVTSLSHLIKQEPAYMSYWGMVYTEVEKGIAEVVLAGQDIDRLRNDLQRHFVPFSIIQGSTGTSDLPLQKDKKPVDGKATIYVCYNKTCKLPVHTVDEAMQQLAQI